MYKQTMVIDLVQDHPHLLVGRSLSKSLLAGVRLGFGIGHPALINVLERLLFAPYHLNHMQMLVAEHYHLIKPHLQSMVRGVVAERSRVETEIGQMGLTHWPSKANFTLFEVGNAKQTYQRLLDHGVRIRDVSSMPGMKEHLRVTIGTKEENNLFLNALSRSV
ncbi:MAG: aminotransferase class I/II-fold pyridoxal phosphate-dependent enzyme [Proteobacteria bacterium]|nr:aminotransferase class I/II-fold pyridoxal phosphate-dependent enzyme [Pseudomonadota bacterium]